MDAMRPFSLGKTMKKHYYFCIKGNQTKIINNIFSIFNMFNIQVIDFNEMLNFTRQKNIVCYDYIFTISNNDRWFGDVLVEIFKNEYKCWIQ